MKDQKELIKELKNNNKELKKYNKELEKNNKKLQTKLNKLNNPKKKKGGNLNVKIGDIYSAPSILNDNNLRENIITNEYTPSSFITN